MSLNDRIERILKVMDWQDQELADKIGMSKQTFSQRKSRNNWSIEEIEEVSKVTGYSFSWICIGNGPEKEVSLVNEPNLNVTDYLKGKIIRPITVTVDKEGKELITYVPVRVQAGYMKGFGDELYIKKLPAFNLPILANGASYRMFEVNGDSMLQIGGGGLHSGDVVIGEYVEDIFSVRDRRVYVVVTTDGIIVKRCINKLKDKANPILVCQSDNKNGQYPDIIVRPNHILEVWELKAFISRQLSFATDIWSLLNDVEAKVAMMNERIEKIETQRLNP